MALLCCLSFLATAQQVPLDSIRLSDPFILADKTTNLYYMPGTGGQLWKSKDLRLWDGPYRVTKTDSISWMGPRPMIWAAEMIERRASHVLVSDQPDGPCVPTQEATYLPADKPTLEGLFVFHS